MLNVAWRGNALCDIQSYDERSSHMTGARFEPDLPKMDRRGNINTKLIDMMTRPL